MKTTTEILWRSKSQATFLPGSDIVWSTFCSVTENGEHNGAAKLIVENLNKAVSTWSINDNVEFKIGEP